MKRIALVIAAAAGLAHGGDLYTIREGDNHLQHINPDTLQITDIGPIGVNFDFGGLAWDSRNNVMYLVDGRGDHGLYTVDLNTGAATLVGTHGVTDIFGLAYDSRNDVLYGTQFSQGSSLYVMDRGTGQANLVGNMGVGMGGLTYNPNTDQLIGMNDGAGDLYEIDRNTAQPSFLYDGDFVNDSGLAYDSEKNLLWDIDWSGNLNTYDVGNGYARTTVLTGLGSYDGLEWVGRVPAPGSMALLGLGGLAAARRRRN